MLQAHDEIVTPKSYHFRSRLNNSLKELETSLSLAKPEAEDEKLAMAARIGLALQEENKFLQKENSKLMVNIVNLEAKIEEDQKEEETYLRRIESLLQKLEEREKQLEKEKQHFQEMQDIFEEHDKKQLHIMEGYIKDIDNLKSKLLEKEATPQHMIVDRPCPTSEIKEPFKVQSTTTWMSPTFFCDLKELKEKQRAMEQKIVLLEGKIASQRKKTCYRRKRDNSKNMFNITNIENENELANTSTILKSSSPKSDGDLHILLLDSEAARDASPQELNDNEDNEITQTRSMSRRIIRAVAVNSNTGRISTIDPQDIPVIGKLKLFGFIPDETPLISTTLCNDDDRLKLCEIGFFDIEKTERSLKLTSETAEDIFKRVNEHKLSYNSFVTF
ncbi:hypothetical protein J6590_024896 [Homalodisca vitripennis]|nr:hypothetical protein J6590_024896 [Homalodisca vitripennis]